MNIRMGDLADRYTILQLKCENGLPCQEEFLELKQEIHNMDGDLLFDKSLLDDLYKINKNMWAIEKDATRSIEEYPLNSNDCFSKGYAALGILYSLQREFNKERVRIKNEINKQVGDSEEVKKYE